MSIQGPSSLPFRPFPGTTPAVARPAASPAPATPAAPAAPTSSSETAAPAGSSLWELLTGEEREFFAQQASLGALTYGRAGAGMAAAKSSASAPLGQRLDVRG